MSLREYVICCPPTSKEKSVFNGSRNFYIFVLRCTGTGRVSQIISRSFSGQKGHMKWVICLCIRWQNVDLESLSFNVLTKLQKKAIEIPAGLLKINFTNNQKIFFALCTSSIAR